MKKKPQKTENLRKNKSFHFLPKNKEKMIMLNICQLCSTDLRVERGIIKSLHNLYWCFKDYYLIAYNVPLLRLSFLTIMVF